MYGNVVKKECWMNIEQYNTRYPNKFFQLFLQFQVSCITIIRWMIENIPLRHYMENVIMSVTPFSIYTSWHHAKYKLFHQISWWGSFPQRAHSTEVYHPKSCRDSFHGNSSHQKIIWKRAHFTRFGKPFFKNVSEKLLMMEVADDGSCRCWQSFVYSYI